LNIISIATTGDFQQTNNCGSSLTAHTNQTCTISLTFVPTAGGKRTGNLLITDNAADSPQTVPLAGVGNDFSLSAPITSASVTRGQSASYSLVLTPQGEFSNAVSLTCTGAPAMSTCSLPSQPVSLAGGAATISVVVTTTAPSLLPPARRLSPPRWSPLVLLAILSLLAFVAASKRQRELLAPLAATLLLVALWASCGGGGGGGGGGGNPGTPTGTYTLTVTGTSGSLTHTLSLTLTVK
jgi:hypothetical protein